MAVSKEPQNLDAEISVLGSAFISNDGLSKVVEELHEDIFYNEANKKIFSVIKDLHTKNIPIDSTSVTNELEKRKELSLVGGIEYISDIINSVATTAYLENHIKIINEKYILRKLIEKSTAIIKSCYDEKDDVDDIVENAEKEILSVNTDSLGKEMKNIQTILPLVQSDVEALAKDQSGVIGVPTGFYGLDDILHGLHKNELIIIAGRPGGGKSAFALNIGTNAALKSGKTIAMFSLEMSAEELVKRMFSSIGGIEGDSIKTGKMSHNDWKRFSEAESELADAKIYIDDTSSITVSEIKRKSRRLANSKDGLDLIIVDYLQLLSSTTKYNGNRVQEVTEISRDLKKLAMDLEVPVIALAQLSRSSEQRKGEDKRPKLSDLRESGSIEQDADVVIFIYSDFYSNLDMASIETEIIVAKHRSGRTDKFNLLFEKNKGCFKNYMKSEED
jgi:replicative DNA helicase